MKNAQALHSDALRRGCNLPVASQSAVRADVYKLNSYLIRRLQL